MEPVPQGFRYDYRAGAVDQPDNRPLQTAFLLQVPLVDAEQIRAVSVERLGAKIGALPPALIAELDEALRLQLAL